MEYFIAFCLKKLPNTVPLASHITLKGSNKSKLLINGLDTNLSCKHIKVVMHASSKSILASFSNKIHSEGAIFSMSLMNFR